MPSLSVSKELMYFAEINGVNRVLFSKTINNKFTTVHNIVSDIFLWCNSNEENVKELVF